MDPPNRKRPNQPFDQAKHSEKRVKHSVKTWFQDKFTTSSGTYAGASPHVSSRVDEQFPDASMVDSQLEHLSQAALRMQENASDATEPSTSIPAIGSQAASMNVAVPTQQLIHQTRGLPPEHTMPGLAQTSHTSSSATSTSRGFKTHATGVAKSTMDLLKIGPLQDIFNMLHGFADMYITKGKVEKEYEELEQQLKALLKIIEEHCDGDDRPTMMLKVNGIRDFIEAELNALENQQSGKQHGRLLQANEDEERTLACCRRIQAYMNQLSLDATLSTWKMKEERSNDHMSALIGRLPSVPSAWYNSNVGADLRRRECTPGTRVSVLANLLDWAGSSRTDTVYWLNGMAGTGKTTIAYSVCKELYDNRKLAASFFCSRMRQECRDVNVIIPSIAYQLARFPPSFQLALSVVLEENQDVHHKVLNEQFEVLIRKPLLVVLASEPLVASRMVVFIDALDECDNRESTRNILNTLLSKTVDLPIKFIVSSRPEPQIRDQMTRERVISRLVLHELDTGDVEADIARYVRDELKPMKPPPEEAQIEALVRKAGILFIYAATAVRYIGYDNFCRHPASRLRHQERGGRMR